jgi:hypothetical protein
MFNIEARTEKIIERFDAMTEKLDTFGATDMPNELTAWQVEDMHRRYPETKVEEDQASTEIFPRSRTYAQTHPHRVAKPRRQIAAMPVLRRQTKLQHPVLRQALLDMLHTRMATLLNGKITWR